jgi:hypothetical protein
MIPLQGTHTAREEDMGDRFKLNPIGTDKALDGWQRLSLDASFNFGWLIDTALSRGSGPEYGFGIDLGFAETLRDMYKFYFQMMWGKSSDPILPSGGPTSPVSFRSILTGFERERRLLTYSDEGSQVVGLSMTTAPLLGETTVSNGNAYGMGGTTDDLFSIGSSLYLNGKVRLGSQAWLNVSPGFFYGVDFDGISSDANRLNLAFMLQASVGLNGTSLISGMNPNTKVGIGGDFFEFYRVLHGYALSYFLNETLSNPQQRLSEYGFDAGGGSGGALAIVPTFKFASTLIGGASDSFDIPLRSDAFWGYLGLLGAGGLTFSILEGDAGRAGGIKDLFKAARLGSYAIAGIEGVDKRLSLDRRDAELREEYVNIANFGLGTLGLAIGDGVGSDILATGAFSANLPFGIDPGQATGMVRKTYFIPSYAAVTNRAGFTLHHNWRHLPLFSGASAMWAGTGKQGDINTYMGGQWETPWTYLFGGLNNNITFGKGNGAGVGIMGGLGVKLIDEHLILDSRVFYNPFSHGDKVDLLLGATGSF